MMQRFGFLLSGVVLCALLVMTGCGAGAAASGSSDAAVAATTAPDGAQQITLTTGNSMSFEPATISVRAGVPVELTLRNGGQMPHDFTLADGVRRPVKISANGGQTSSGTFALDSPGTYHFECSMPGHAGAGMRGTLIVQ